MKDLLKNKKILLPIILGVAIIIIAIIIFILIGSGSKKNTSRVDTIHLTNTPESTNELGNTYANEPENKPEEKPENKVDEKKEYGSDYESLVRMFIDGFTDQDVMDDFVKDHFDSIAYVAYENADGDESRFMDEYGKLDKNDSDVVELEKNISSMPEAMEQFKEMLEALAEMGEDADMEAPTDEDGNPIDITDLKITVKSIGEPEISEDFPSLFKVEVELELWGETTTMIMVFYNNPDDDSDEDIAVYMMNEDGESFIDVMKQTAQE